MATLLLLCIREMHVSLLSHVMKCWDAMLLAHLPTPCILYLQVCHVRNIHGRSLADIRVAARALERIPSLYPQLDASGLLQKGLPEPKQVHPYTLLVLHSSTASSDSASFPALSSPVELCWVRGLYRDFLTYNMQRRRCADCFWSQ